MKVLGLFTFLLWLALIIGEVLCIIKFFKCDFDSSKTSNKAEWVYGISAVTGIGCITGYFNFGK
jgi:hypothetical protein